MLLGWVGKGGLCPTVRERGERREKEENGGGKRTEEGRERREKRDEGRERRVDPICHMDATSTLNSYFNTV